MSYFASRVRLGPDDHLASDSGSWVTGKVITGCNCYGPGHGPQRAWVRVFPYLGGRGQWPRRTLAVLPSLPGPGRRLRPTWSIYFCFASLHQSVCPCYDVMIPPRRWTLQVSTRAWVTRLSNCQLMGTAGRPADTVSRRVKGNFWKSIWMSCPSHGWLTWRHSSLSTGCYQQSVASSNPNLTAGCVNLWMDGISKISSTRTI